LKAVRFDNWLLARIRALPSAERHEVGEAIRRAQESFGQPHLHLGVGLRKLSEQHFEIRVGLDIRLIFTNEPTELKFVFMGNHDEVRRFLRSQV
jgi:hypothetical protein